MRGANINVNEVIILMTGTNANGYESTNFNVNERWAY